MTLAAGSIAFTGFNADGNDNLAFVALDALAAGTVIFFSDNEWNGSAIGAGGAFNTGESFTSLTLTQDVSAGTVITLNDFSLATLSSNIGTLASVAVSGSTNRGIAASNETVYAYLGTSAAAPTVFLAAITNSSFSAADGQLLNTGLTAGVNALQLSPIGTDIAAFNGARGNQSSFAAYAAILNNAANWITQDATGDQSLDGIAPDVPFVTTAFTLAGGNATVAINDVSITEGNAGTSLLTFTVTRSDSSGAFSIDYATADGTAAAPGDYAAISGTISFVVGGALSQTFSVIINGDTTVEANETLTVTLSNLVNSSGTATIADASGLGTITNDDVAVIAIHDIQGAAHISSLVGQSVTTTGIVTAVDTNGFYLQAADADADANFATSEAIFVFTSSAPTVAVGQAINVTGTVSEFIPGGATSNNLSTTELVSPSGIVVLSSGNALPTATVIGAGGRVPPTEIIDNDNFAVFDPNQDGIDFYESLEAMRVTVHAPRVVGATNSFGEIFTVADNGAGATGLSARGAIISTGSVGDGLNVTNTGPGSDYNPERIQIDADSFTPGAIPSVNVGTVLNDVTGVLGYSFGNFEVLATSAVTVNTASTLTQETTSLAGSALVLTIADMNVENLDANDADGDSDVADGRFAEIANQVVNRLGRPDIISLQEIQDNSGSVDDGVISASLTLQTLVNAISAAGGPTYSFIDNPFITNDTNGGQPGGNIRVAYLYDATRVTLAAPVSTTANAAVDFAGSRPPLVASFSFGSETVTLVDNHFSSKGGSSPLFGSVQPSINGVAAARLVQAQNVADFVTGLGPAAKVVVLGDLNEFTNEESLVPLTNAGLSPLSLTLSASERYSYVFEGNGQELDQVYVSGTLLSRSSFDIVHTNAEFADSVSRASDHDPSVLAINFTPGAQSLGFATASLSFAQAEGNAATTSYSFIIERSGGTDGTLDFGGTIVAGTTDAADFGGTLPVTFTGSIAAGATSAVVTVTISGDARVEANENFSLTLTSASNSASAPVSIAGSAATATATITNDDAIDLSTYVRVGRYDLPEPTRSAHPANSLLAQEASAVTYDKDTDTLFVVGDGGTSIVQVSKTGVLIDSMTLAPGGSPQGTAFYDPEGIAYLGNGQFVFTEERDRNLVKFTYVAGGVLTRADAQIAHLGTFVQNIGLEGVTTDPLTNGFILVKEKGPEGIFQTTIDFATDTASNGAATTVNSINLFNPALLNLLDFADIYALSNVTALATTGQADHLFVLSQESGKIVEIDRTGNILSTLAIVSDPGNPLDVVAQQHEGVTVGADGTLYVVSENGGGDFDHPQLWVYQQSLVPNAAPTGIALGNSATTILENTSTAARVKVADIVISDDGLGNNNLSLAGADAASFDVDSTGLYIKAGTVLDYETKTSYAVTVNVDDPAVGGAPDASVNYILNVTDVVDETALPSVYISEVAPWSSGNSPVAADWFEVTNGGNAALDITGWRMDDNSNTFANSVALTGITSIAAGQSVIFIEAAPADAATRIASFITTWFGGVAPSNVQIGTYSGSGVGLSTGGDAVNLYNAAGALRANVSFGTSPAGPGFATFNNAAGLNIASISTLSKVGTNLAAAAPGDANEIGSPGTVGRLIVSEVAPWSSGNSPVAADWFELTNTTVESITISGWKIDDNSGSPAAAVALNGVTTIAPGESVIFIESANPAAARATFVNNWFGGNAPANLQIGTYTGTGVGLSTGGDAVNIYDGTNALRASVTFGASPAGPYPTFDNAAGRNGTNVTIAQLSVAGTNAAHVAANHATETGSPGEIAPVNDAPTAVNDNAGGIIEDGNAVATGNVLANDTDPDLVQTSTEVLSVTGARAGAEAAGGSLTAVAGATVIDGVYGQMTINPDGSYSYALDNSRAVTQALQPGQVATESFTYRVADAHGLVDIAQLDLTINGAYDAGDAITGTALSETINGTSSGETIFGRAGNDVINGLGGDDILNGGVGADRLNGGEGNDTVSYATAASAISASLSNNSGSFGEAIGDRFVSIENLTGSDFDDVLLGNGGANVLNGGNGNDFIRGGGGADVLIGGDGADILSVSGTQLFASIDGGSGYDTIVAGANATRIAMGNITGIEAISGNGYANVTINGSTGDDIVDYSSFDLSGITAINGNGGNDTIIGSGSADVINGDGGGDTLLGGGGDDIISGGAGVDTLGGGLGADTFVFLRTDRPSISDTILDFNEAEGDRIDLSLIDANPRSPGNSAFSFIGDQAFNESAGELRFFTLDGSVFVQGDVNGDAVADFTITLISNTTVTSAAFIL